jgi:DivIVA domain-containing protein
MTWVFGILVVLALGGVAAVAAGRGMSLPESFDDRTDSRVPSGTLSAADVRTVRFPMALRGYRCGEVDALLDLLAVQLAEQQAELERLRGSVPGTTPEPVSPPEEGPVPRYPSDPTDT